MLMIGPYVIDAALSEDHSKDADVSEFPVEDGSNFTDNVRVKPRTYRVSGLVTDTPLDLGFRSIEDDGTPLIDTSTRPSAQARIALEGIMDAEQPITIITELATYKDMVMTSLSFQQDADTGDSLPFTASFRQINIVENQRRVINVKFTAVDRGNLAAHAPGWIGNDKTGREIFVDPSSKGIGLEPKYIRADGTTVPQQEAADASRKTTGAVLVKYVKGSDGNPVAVPVDPKDYQPYTPKQKTPFWNPPQRTFPAPEGAGLPALGT